MKGCLKGILILVVLMVVFLVIAAIGKGSIPATSTVPAAAVSGQATKVVVIPGPGTTIQVGKIAWTVREAKALGKTLPAVSTLLDAKQTSGQFIRVRYQIENTGSDKVYYQAPKLVDSQGRKYGDYGQSTFYIVSDELCVLQELNPNVPKTCTEIYEVAGDANSLLAEATSLSLLGASPAVINLNIP